MVTISSKNQAGGSKVRKTAVAMLSVVMLLAPSVDAHPSASTRTVTQNYAQPNGIFVSGLGFWSNDSDDIPRFSAKPGDKSVRIRIDDTTGLPVHGRIWLDRDGDGKHDLEHDFCQSTLRSLRVTGRSRIEVWIVTGSCRDGSPSFATSGQVTATFRK